MNKWPENFIYKIDLRVGVFAMSIAVTFIVAVVAVGYKSVKAGLINSVKSLRSE
jgi:putative ABC transport system permease protein